ncbi:LysM peptidoglycan-binding domain-containing protein [Paenibacillus alba]|nr:LysM peptidoglycan-binding domain-containing protein [Paenibacillus alba]
MVLKIHIVKKGDSLYELAKKYQTTLDQIIALNPQLADPNHLDIGMKVKIPSKPSHFEPPAEYAYKHVVVQGDSLWKLGKAWDVPLHAMIQANPQLKNPNVLMTGEVVYVPKFQHHEHEGSQGQAATTPVPSSKPSTMPFEQMPAEQPWTPVDMNQQPVMPIAEAPVPVPTPAPEPAPIIPQPILSSQMEPSSIMPAPEPEVFEMPEQHEKAVHPFKQFHISATEVSVYPESEQPEASTYPVFAQQPEASTYPAFSAYQQPPWEQASYSNQPQMTYPASEEGCGCGGPSMMEQPWSTIPAGYPTGSVGTPWDGYQQGSPTIPGLYPPASPYDMQQGVQHPYGDYPQAGHHHQSFGDYPQAGHHHQSFGDYPAAGHLHHHSFDGYQQAPYGIPYAGAHYEAPYESPMMPQVHTHELAKETNTDEIVEIDIRSDKPTKSKTHRSTKKVRLSGSSALNSFLKRQQRADEKQESKPAGPWINF